MKNDEIVLKKIELKPFIDSLIEMYNEGMDFIDIIAVPGVLKDSITLVGRQDEPPPSDSPPEQDPKPLSEEDINKLASI